MIRNCADHGLEPPAAREAAGKPAEGTITLRASQRGANLEIEIEDDGAGIDPERVRAGAVKKGLLTAEAAEAFNEREALWLIVRPGLSTNATVTDVSGRGVGMDVVREAVERMHGMIDVQSRLGQDTRFSISLPLSVATTRCLLVEAGGQAFALPISGIDRIVRLGAGDIGLTEGREAIRVDGRPMALARLADVLGIAGGGPKGTASAQPAIVLGAGERRVAFMVDGLIGAQEIAIKQLPRPLVRVRHIAGATIVGTGDVVAILNVADLLRSVGRGGASAALATSTTATSREADKTILVADDSMTIRTLNKNILQAAGYQVKVAADGQEAWNMIEGQGCDLVVSDWEMPKLDGCQLAEKVRGDDRFKDLPFILVTSLDSKEHRERGIAAGADAYIVKGGFDQDKLLETVSRLI
jgi:two-component system chemotaxis sensor kinase CheA